MFNDTASTDSSESVDIPATDSSSSTDDDDDEYAHFVPEQIIKKLDAQINDKELFTFLLNEGKKGSCDENSLNLLYRKSQNDLFKETVSMVSEAKATFEARLLEAAGLFFSNINGVLSLDKACNDVDENLGSGKNFDPIVNRLSDGSLKLNCPMKDCATTTYRLKRHLSTQHRIDDYDRVRIILQMARKMEKNKLVSDECYIEKNISESIKSKEPKKYRPIHHVDRRTNFIKCHLCNSLVSNISQHLNKGHKLSKLTNEYSTALKQCVVIPKVYTRNEGKKVVELHGAEYDEAVQIYGEEVDKEHSIMMNLRQFRDDMQDLILCIQGTDNAKEKESLQEKLKVATKKYKDLRYRDTRKYSDKSKAWRDSFESYLRLRDNYNPKRCASMAIDIIMKFEVKNGPISFNDLTNIKHLRKIVQGFKDSHGMKANSKIKYLKMFCCFLKYLFTDCDSPEKTEEEDLSSKMLNSVLFREAESEVDNVIVSLMKETGRERLQSRDKTAKNLLSKEDLKRISDTIRSDLLKILTDDPNKRALYTVSEVLAARNNLMAIAFLNLGRRSMEMTTMTTEEVDNAEKTVLENDEEYYVVEVMEQKSLKSGKKAAVTFKSDEFEVLQVFIKELRKKICFDEKLKCVFPSSDEGGRKMTLGSVWKILNKYKSASNVKLTSQIIRKSKITNSRTLGLTAGQKDATAAAMGHDTVTGDRYYAIHSLVNSTNACLSLEKSIQDSTEEPSFSVPTSTSTPMKEVQNMEELPSTSSHGTNKAIKRTVHFDEGSESSDLEPLDLTIMNLRTKKLKLGNKEAEHELISSIGKIISALKDSGDLNLLYSEKGLLSVKYISQRLPTELRKKFTIKKIREVANKFI